MKDGLVMIDKVGIRDYSDVSQIGGKVEITRDFLKKIAENNFVTRLTDCTKGHPGPKIGMVKELQVIDDVLYGKVITNEDLEGKGYSTSLEFDVAEGEDGIGTAINPRNLDHIGATPSPRSGLINNSKPTDSSENGDPEQKKENRNDNMSDDNLELEKKVNKLEKDLNKVTAEKLNLEKAIAKKDIELAKLDDVKEDLTNMTNERDKAKSEIDELKPKAEKYDVWDTTNREKLIKQHLGKKEEDTLTEQDLKPFEGLDTERVKALIDLSITNETIRGGGQRGSSSNPNKKEEKSSIPATKKEWKENKEY